MDNVIQITLAAARVNAGLTQDEVAKRLHVSKTTVVNWEKGKIIPTFIVATTLSNLYKIPIDNIILPQKST
ncbi:MAG: helix-turn-helix transcriptional regulator [Lachnospiraceae bacterium]|nr:helix-turn-helix transcriptional regulator [Lachnospiraceae bacterium]